MIIDGQSDVAIDVWPLGSGEMFVKNDRNYLSPQMHRVVLKACF